MTVVVYVAFEAPAISMRFVYVYVYVYGVIWLLAVEGVLQLHAEHLDGCGAALDRSRHAGRGAGIFLSCHR